jgi:hypothetical protein
MSFYLRNNERDSSSDMSPCLHTALSDKDSINFHGEDNTVCTCVSLQEGHDGLDGGEPKQNTLGTVLHSTDANVIDPVFVSIRRQRHPATFCLSSHRHTTQDDVMLHGAASRATHTAEGRNGYVACITSAQEQLIKPLSSPSTHHQSTRHGDTTIPFKRVGAQSTPSRLVKSTHADYDTNMDLLGQLRHPSNWASYYGTKVFRYINRDPALVFRGGNAIVHQGTLPLEGRRVAVKTIHSYNKDSTSAMKVSLRLGG